jgi:plastocyanin
VRRTKRRFISWSLVVTAVSAAALALGAPAANAGGSCHGEASVAAGIHVSLSELCFGPTVLYVSPGETVTWTNKESTAHTVTGLGFSWGSDGDLLQGDAVSYRFAQPGIYPYSCIIHPGMVGAVVVGDAGSPSAAVGLAAPVLVQANPPAANVAQPAPAQKVQTVAAGFWRALALISLSLLVGVAVTVALQWRQRSRRESYAVS